MRRDSNRLFHKFRAMSLYITDTVSQTVDRLTDLGKINSEHTSMHSIQVRHFDLTIIFKTTNVHGALNISHLIYGLGLV